MTVAFARRWKPAASRLFLEEAEVESDVGTERVGDVSAMVGPSDLAYVI